MDTQVLLAYGLHDYSAKNVLRAGRHRLALAIQAMQRFEFSVAAGLMDDAAELLGELSKHDSTKTD